MTHPAAQYLAAGHLAEAITVLTDRGDHPAALALLRAGFELYATWLLEDMAPTPMNDTLPPPAGWADGANA
jgi:hypothetical protein